jgi:DNA-binding response OmpR family regulator
MDRVLIVSEEVIFASHVEKTLKEVGFEVAIQSNESGLQQAIQNFNPDVLVVKGGSVRVSSLRIGQILKETIKYTGKVILIVNKSENIDPDDINRVKMDYLLFEPVGAVKVVSHVLALMPEQRDALKNRLQKMTESDPNFRKQEELFTVSGKAAEQEMVHVTGKVKKEDLVHVQSTEAITPEEMQHIKSNIEKELADNGPLHLKKIESYNKAIGNLDVDLKKGLNKRQTNAKQKALRKELLVDPGQEKLDSLDEDRRRFATALMKKK